MRRAGLISVQMQVGGMLAQRETIPSFVDFATGKTISLRGSRGSSSDDGFDLFFLTIASDVGVTNYLLSAGH